MICTPDLVQTLEEVFSRIHVQRMQGVPVLNRALRVQAVGFTPWQGYSVGVLITPWFMNLMLLSGRDGEWKELPVGGKLTHRFPSGACEVILGDEEGLGRYLMCSLFSPVFRFADQPSAVTTAKAVMAGLMDAQNRDDTSMREREIERIWRGETQPEGSGKTLAKRFQRPISRRDLLRGILG